MRRPRGLAPRQCGSQLGCAPRCHGLRADVEASQNLIKGFYALGGQSDSTTEGYSNRPAHAVSSTVRGTAASKPSRKPVLPVGLLIRCSPKSPRKSGPGAGRRARTARPTTPGPTPAVHRPRWKAKSTSEKLPCSRPPAGRHAPGRLPRPAGCSWCLFWLLSLRELPFHLPAWSRGWPASIGSGKFAGPCSLKVAGAISRPPPGTLERSRRSPVAPRRIATHQVSADRIALLVAQRPGFGDRLQPVRVALVHRRLNSRNPLFDAHHRYRLLDLLFALL